MSIDYNPYISELYALGYNKVKHQTGIDSVISLYKDDHLVKAIPENEFIEIAMSCTIIKAIDIHGQRNHWIKESDGSAERFRDFIDDYRGCTDN